MVDKVVATAAQALRDVPDGASVAVGGLLMEHVARDGSPKRVDALSLPATGRGVVSRVITDLAVLDVEDGAFVLCETAPGVSVDEVRDKTGGPLRVPGATGTADRPHSHT